MLTSEDVKKKIDAEKAQGATDEDLLQAFYIAFQSGEINKEQLEDMCSMIGYELTEDFKNASEEDMKDDSKWFGDNGVEDTVSDADSKKEEDNANPDSKKDETNPNPNVDKADLNDDAKEIPFEDAKKLFGL